LSPLKILADENIESSIIKFLESKGFDVKRGPKGLKNSELLSLAEKEERVLLTHDHDFLRIDIVCQPTKISFRR
jgi:predicted nuclease of predicted toxin-antitoxin system